MSDTISGKLHPIPSTIANKRWISIRNIIIYLETKFFSPQKLQHTTVDIPTKWIIIWLPNHEYQFPTSKSTWKTNFAQIGGYLYFGGHFRFKMAAIANQRWISICNIIVYFEAKFRPNWRFFVFWRPFWIQNGRHSKPTININSQDHNLLGIQISPKSEDFCIWRPFCTLVTIATVAIFNFFNPSKAATHCGGYSYKVSWSLMKGIQIFFKYPLFCFHDNCGKVCPTDSDFFGLSHSTRCGCRSYHVSSISVRRVTWYDLFWVFIFFGFWPFPWQWRPFWTFRK